MATEFAESAGRPVALPGNGDEQAWRAIDLLVEELAGLARSAIPIPEFYAALVSRLLTALPLSGGAVWQFVPTMPVVLIAEVGTAPNQGAEMLRWLEGIRTAGSCPADECLILSPNSTGGRTLVANPWPMPLVLRAVRPDDSTTYLLVLSLHATAAPASQQAVTQLVDLFCETALDLHQQRELHELRKQQLNLRQFGQLVERLHCSLELNQTVHTLANDGRVWIGCDRLSVALIRGGRARIWAVSGSAHVNHRAQQIRKLETLLTAVNASGEPLLWSDECTGELPPELAAPLQDYLNDAHARQLLAVPLRIHAANNAADAAEESVGIVLAESFTAGQASERLRQRVDEVVRHGRVALAHALVYHEMPLRPLQDGVRRTWRGLRRWPVAALLAALCAAAVLAALVFVPADFSVSATGRLLPQSRRHLFAPADGVVEQVFAEHGRQVKAGDELLRLRDPELELDYSRIGGELQTAQARLAAVRARRSMRSSSPNPQEADRQLAAEEEQLKQLQNGLMAQLQLLQSHRAELRVASPITGVVLTWNAAELLQDRPVREGQRLLTVADPSGPWVLEVPVPDTAIGHILSAQKRGEPELPVTFLLATEPAVTHRGRVAQVAQNSDTAEGQPPSVLITVELPDAVPDAARSGAGVLARIHCGQRPLGYVWLHDLIDAVRTQILF